MRPGAKRSGILISFYTGTYAWRPPLLPTLPSAFRLARAPPLEYKFVAVNVWSNSNFLVIFFVSWGRFFWLVFVFNYNIVQVVMDVFGCFFVICPPIPPRALLSVLVFAHTGMLLRSEFFSWNALFFLNCFFLFFFPPLFFLSFWSASACRESRYCHFVLFSSHSVSPWSANTEVTAGEKPSN